jgi:hypothetical protein
VGSVDGALRLTLAALLLQPVGDATLRPLVLVAAALGLVLPRALRSPFLWGTLAALTAARIVLDWPMSDNHAYLLCWWCLAATITLASADAVGCLRLNARLLVGLAFTFASLWKVALSPDFLDGRFFRVALVGDVRFERFTMLVGGLSAEDLRAMRDVLFRHVDGPAPASAEALRAPERLRWVAHLATWWVAALETALAVAFLAPSRWLVARTRHALLLAFVVTTYAVAPVEGFGWLLVAQGFAQAGAARAQVAYLAAFAALVVSHQWR